MHPPTKWTSCQSACKIRHMSKSIENSKKPLSRGLRIYQRIAIVFVFLSFLLLLFVLYLSVSAATITIIPVEQIVSTRDSVEVVPEAIQDGQISGFVRSQSFSQSKEFPLPEEGAVAQEGNAGGKVTLINETASDQALVKDTRVLSEGGVLFRLENGTVVPANGQGEVLVYADQPGTGGNIGPAQFTIPGLAVSLQSVIYAVSVESMTGGVVYVRALTEQDLDTAALELKEDILLGAKEILAQEIDTDKYNGVAYFSEVTALESDTEPGTEAGSFMVSQTVQVSAIFYETTLLDQYMRVNLQNEISSDFQVVAVAEGGVQAEVQAVDIVDGSAVLSIYLDGTAVISQTNSVLEKSRLLGRSPSEAATLLESSDLIESVRIRFTPFWLKRIPTLADHITIEIEK